MAKLNVKIKLMKSRKNKKMDDVDSKNTIIIEKKIHRTNRQRILHTLCLFLPILTSFGMYFLSSPLWNFFNKTMAAPEIYKFLCTAIVFLISSLIVFLATRKINPIMKIKLTNAPSPTD